MGRGQGGSETGVSTAFSCPGLLLLTTNDLRLVSVQQRQLSLRHSGEENPVTSDVGHAVQGGVPAREGLCCVPL